MEQLERNLRLHGVNVPTMHNDASPNGNYYEGPGATDVRLSPYPSLFSFASTMLKYALSLFGRLQIYGFDSYPQSFDCSNPTVWKDLPTNWHERHMSINPDQPFWIPEFQGGAFE
jgi:hypothetical protein